MAGISSITNAWSLVSELDLRPVPGTGRDQTEHRPGWQNGQRAGTCWRNRCGAIHPVLGMSTRLPCLISNPEEAHSLPQADLVILLLNTAEQRR